jgi:hypothetical protein
MKTKIIAKGVCSTNGKGIWSNHVVKNIPVILIPEDEFMLDGNELYGHLQAHFSKKDWDVNKHGLIYTDDRFKKDIRKVLKVNGFKNYHDIGYSEQGMQGANYVDFDIGNNLCREIIDKGFKIKTWSYE